MSVATIKQEVPTANGFYLNYDVGRRTNRERLAPVVPTVTRVADPEEIEWLRWQSIRLEVLPRRKSSHGPSITTFPVSRWPPGWDRRAV